MSSHPKVRTWVFFILIVVLVVGLSMLSTRIWRGKPEQPPQIKELSLNKDMTILDFGQANGFPNPTLKEIFDLRVQADLEKKLDEYGTMEQITSMVTRKMALASEHATKNWIKIPIKFGL